MRRDLALMSEKMHDVVIIGGGITGSTIAWDASLRGLSVALVEAKDFSHATSAASSKLVHGGLRYLKNLEVRLIRESLRERRIWEIIAPHMVDPLAFLMPTYGHGLKGRFITHVGLTIYDWLSYDRGWLQDDDKKIPAHITLSTPEALARDPGLRKEKLNGAVLYYDCQMYSPERLGLECLIGATDNGAEVANYAEVKNFKYGVTENGRAAAGIEVVDRLTGATHIIRGRTTVNATGPWADFILERALGGKSNTQLVRSKGIHFITRSLTGPHAVAVQKEGGHFFILPWRGHSIIGTTDTVFKGDPGDVEVTEEDIAEFLEVVNRGYPGARLKREDILHAYCGLRPIVDNTPNSADDDDSYNASRKAEICDHQEEGLDNLFSAIGGKWTTSRQVAQDVVDRIATKLERMVKPCETHTTPLPGGEIGRFESFVRRSESRYNFFDQEVARHLARTYGSRLVEISDLCSGNNELCDRLSPKFPDIAGQVTHAVQNEMAMTVEDFLFRRSGIGTLGHPGGDVVARIARLMAAELGWDQAETIRQIESAEGRFINTMATAEAV